MKISELMTREVHTIEPGTRLHAAAKVMREHGVGALPVAENDRLIGMVTDRDMVTRGLAAKSDVSETTVRDVMSSEILYCLEDQTVEETLENMATVQVRRLPVIDSDKTLVGMISLGDLAPEAAPEKAHEALAGISRDR